MFDGVYTMAIYQFYQRRPDEVLVQADAMPSLLGSELSAARWAVLVLCEGAGLTDDAGGAE